MEWRGRLQLVRRHVLDVKGNDMPRFTLLMALIALLLSSGCESRNSSPSASATSASSVATANLSTAIERVRKIVSEQMGVALEKVTPQTSLGDLAADELDFVELIM